jgi:PAS domain S-box-containing protein
VQETQSLSGQWHIIKIHPYVTHANLVDGAIITQVEITERKATEEALRERETQLHNMFRDAAIGINRLNLEGQFLETNPAFQEMVGYSPRELHNLSYLDLTHPDDRQASTEDFQKLLSGNKNAFTHEKRYFHKNGAAVWVKTTASLIRDDDQNPLFVVKMVENTSQQKTAERKLHMFESALFASGDAVVITDPKQADNPIVFINPAFEQLTGYKASQIIGHNCRFMQKRDKDQPALDELRQAIKKGERCQVTLRNYRKDGSLFYNHLTIFPVHNEKGELVHFVGIQQEVFPPEDSGPNQD